MADQQFCLRWNNHQSTLISVLDSLLENGTLVDCTLAAEGQYLPVHKVVLSACSPYLETLLSRHYEKHPIVILKDVKYTELRAMVDYMYRGEVNISQDQLGTFLKAAESLQIKGLSDNGTDGDARDVGSTPKAAPAKAQPAPTNRLESQRPELSPPSSAHRTRDGSISPSSRKRRRIRRNSQGDDSNMGDSHLDSNSCDLPNQPQSTPLVPNIPATVTSISATPIKPTIVKPEQTDLVNRIDSSNLNSLPPESGLLKEKIEPISEPLLEPKTEYLEDTNNDDIVEDLTLDDDDEMDEMDMSNMSNMSNISRPGPSHGNDVSQIANQGFVPWQLGGNQSGTDEVFMAAQEAVQAHRGGDSQGDSVNETPGLNNEECFASAFCSVGYGPSETYFSELNNCGYQEENTTWPVSEQGLCLGKETESVINECRVSDGFSNKRVAKSTKKTISSRSTTKKFKTPFNPKNVERDKVSKVYSVGGITFNKRKRLSIRDMFSVKATYYNTQDRQKESRQKVQPKTFLGETSKTEGNESSSLKRKRRALVWSGNSFTTVNHSNSTISEPPNNTSTTPKKVVRKKYATKSISPNARQFNTQTPGVFECDLCGRQYKYLRGLRQHKTYACKKEPKFGCTLCEYKSYLKQSLQYHVKTWHQEHFEEWFKENYKCKYE